MPPYATRDLAAFAAGLRFDDIPAPVIDHVKLSFLDALEAILVEERLNGADIAAIDVGCGRMTFVHTAWTYGPVGVTAAQNAVRREDIERKFMSNVSIGTQSSADCGIDCESNTRESWVGSGG